LDASVIIATYNRKELLEACLRCLDAQDHPRSEFEVIVVDDGSTDGSLEMAKAWPATYTLRCISAGHQGIGPARNLGVSEAKGDIVIFLDDDAFAPPWYVSEHVKSHREAAGPVFVAGPAIYVSGRETIKDPPFTSLKIRAKAFMDFFAAPFVGVNVSCPREDFLCVQGFDTRFGKAYGFQDTEMGFRLRLAGVGSVNNRRAYVLHHTSGTSTLELEMKKSRERGGTAAIFYGKYNLPEVKKLIHWERLKWDSRLDRWGLLRWATAERVASWKQTGHPMYPVVRKMLLIHLFATELRKGLADFGIAAEE
jgi:glycosyltransferase involved in cell wall biosynthesis